MFTQASRQAPSTSLLPHIEFINLTQLSQQWWWFMICWRPHYHLEKSLNHPGESAVWMFSRAACVSNLGPRRRFFYCRGGNSLQSAYKGHLQFKRSKETSAFLSLMLFVSSLWCEIKTSARVICSYLQFVNVIFRKWGFFKKVLAFANLN